MRGEEELEAVVEAVVEGFKVVDGVVVGGATVQVTSIWRLIRFSVFIWAVKCANFFAIEYLKKEGTTM